MGPSARLALLALRNRSWHSGVPSTWLKATVIRILKKNKPSDQINSYRPISLTCLLTKIMEQMVTSRMS
ncbi:hypothetical protein TNCT_371961 [Trichonephila clavata]|uniref:Reverse transcriptase n=1 Tax=Trichonephila clavata TaxID=2740835 RepID=A0A8X6I8W0_TRICU|nr:hypothetical protein TNCT_371961 [Trichonephila clavata]